MGKYQILYHLNSGAIVEDDNFGSFYKSEEEALRAAEFGSGEFAEGGDNLEMHNSGDYPFDEDACMDITYEIEQVE